MEIRPKVYCTTCGENRTYKIESSDEEAVFNGVSFIFNEVRARCRKCNQLVRVPALEDRNWYERHKAYYNQLNSVFKEDKNEH